MSGPPRQIQTRTGIVGIERNIEQKQKATDATISQAFQDLKVLMDKAQEMVALSRSISGKIKEKQGAITEDETVQFKSYLLSMGIDDPVTRDDCKSSSAYYTSLAKQISELLVKTVTETSGQMTLPDVYCRVNRARGFDLVSPDDLLRACQMMESLQLPLKLRKLKSGVMVLQLSTLSDENLAKDTAEIVKKHGSIAAMDLAQQCLVPVAVAQERLEAAERLGLLVRDNSTSGLSFFWNLLLYPDEDLIIPYLY